MKDSRNESPELRTEKKNVWTLRKLYNDKESNS